MAEIKVTFDAVEVDNPINWKEISIRYKRDKVLNGLYTQYTSDLKWTGNAYQAIITALTSNPCGIIAVVISSRCSSFDSFTELFSGEISLSDIEIDATNCIATAAVEQSDCISRFINLVDKLVDFETPYALDGVTAMTSPVQLINDMFVAYATSGTLWTAQGWNDPYAVSLYDAFEFIAKYLTNDCLKFTSDFFSTAYQSQIVRIDFTGNPANGENIVIECTDDFTGIQYSYTAEYQTGLGVPAYELVRNTLVANNSLPSTAAAHIFSNGICGVDYSVPGGGVNARFDLIFHMPTTITAFTYGSGTATQTEIQSFQKGGKDMFFTNEKGLLAVSPQEYGTNSISFTDLYGFAKNIFDLGMSFEESGGVWYLRIEPAEYYLDVTSALTLRNIKDIQWKYDKDQLANSVAVGTEYQKYIPYTGVSTNENKGENREFFGTRFPTTTTDCNSIIDRSVSPDYYHLLGDKMNAAANGDDAFKDQIYLIHCYESGGNYYPFEYRIDNYDLVVFTTYYDLVVYNKTTSWANLLYYHAYTSPEVDVTAYSSSIKTDTVIRSGVYGGAPPYTFTATNATTGSVVISEGDGYTNRLYSFTDYLSKTDWDLIVDSQRITINSGSDPTNDKDGFIDDAIFNVFDGRTQFTIRTK